MYDLAENDDFDREMIATYEEVAKLYPRPGIYRPIVLIGAPGVGRNELIKMLIEKDPEKYRCPVPCKKDSLPNSLKIIIYKFALKKDTTRPPKSGEVAGREYLFVSREKMEADIAAGGDKRQNLLFNQLFLTAFFPVCLGKFIEHGEFRGHLYGTSGDSVKSIINSGSVCIMNPHYQAIKALRTPQLKPYIIYMKPPLFDDLKMTRTTAKAISSHDETSSRGFTVINN
jgi:MAGUK p55 subfamily member 3/7